MFYSYEHVLFAWRRVFWERLNESKYVLYISMISKNIKISLTSKVYYFRMLECDTWLKIGYTAAGIGGSTSQRDAWFRVHSNCKDS